MISNQAMVRRDVSPSDKPHIDDVQTLRYFHFLEHAWRLVSVESKNYDEDVALGNSTLGLTKPQMIRLCLLKR